MCLFQLHCILCKHLKACLLLSSVCVTQVCASSMQMLSKILLLPFIASSHRPFAETPSVELQP